MMYYLQVSFLVQILLVFTCQVQTSKADKNQRNLLRQQFQKALINDSEKLLTLQQVFLTPRPKNPNGVYLSVSVTVEGRVNADIDNLQYNQYLIDNYCYSYVSKNNLCAYHTSMKFEVSPPEYSTVINFLNEAHDIRVILTVLDPSFYSLSRAFRCFDAYDTTESNYKLDLYVDEIEIIRLGDLPTDIHNALYLTLSWVSLNNTIP